MVEKSIAIVVYGEPDSGRNALTEEKYRSLGNELVASGFKVDSVLYHGSVAESLRTELKKYQAILVWVNPIEQGNDRSQLDALLKQVASSGVLVSAHPDTILKLGTKGILYETRNEEFGGETRLYRSGEEFRKNFHPRGQNNTSIIKQYRGNGGQGVFRVSVDDKDKNHFRVTEASNGAQESLYSITEFYSTFQKFFDNGGMIIEQGWNPNIINGMVRCYLSMNKVAGFGYQEINALYPFKNFIFKKPSRRYYFSEDCGLFADLRSVMENKWVGRLQEITGVVTERLPVIWDVDFFINEVNESDIGKKYSLCEINTSSVSPFPESAIPYIVENVSKRINIQ